jgi:hypothetical protein
VIDKALAWHMRVKLAIGVAALSLLAGIWLFWRFG